MYKDVEFGILRASGKPIITAHIDINKPETDIIFLKLVFSYIFFMKKAPIITPAGIEDCIIP